MSFLKSVDTTNVVVVENTFRDSFDTGRSAALARWSMSSSVNGSSGAPELLFRLSRMRWFQVFAEATMKM